MSEMFKDSVKNFGISLNETQLSQFCLYKNELVAYNEVMNLTAVPTEEIEKRHFLDSLSVLLSGKIEENASVIDIGTGAGFPGLPLAIARPDVSVTLLDSLHKRTQFLETVTGIINTQNTTVLCARAEDAAKDENREAFDICVSRAVASLNVLCEYALPFVKVGGYFVAMKGPETDEEIQSAKNAIEILGGKLTEVKKVKAYEDAVCQTLIIIKKVGQTPTKYPRRAGKATKKPIE